MKDGFFSRKVYQGLYTPVYRFAEFGDVSNYWIELSYLCNRDDWQSLKGSLGSPLDFDLLNEDGDKIFGEVEAEHLTELKSRGYVLGGIPEPEPDGEDETIVHARELYVYAPDREYFQYDSDVVPIWGLNDTDYATQTPIIIGANAGHVQTTQFYNNCLLPVADVSNFKTGDFVLGHYTCRFGAETGATGTVLWYDDAWCEFGPAEIVRIDGNLIELKGSGASWPTHFDEKYANYNNHNIYRDTQWYKILNGLELTPQTYGYYCMRPTSGYLLKAYATRAHKKRQRIIRERVSFHMEFPELPEIFVPQKETGFEETTISRYTVPTPGEWKGRVASGEWFIYAEPTVQYIPEANIYERRIRETPCF